MKLKKMFLSGFVVAILVILFAFENKVDASVLVQGEELSEERYQGLLESIPEGYELVSNEEYNSLVNKRATTGLFHQSHIQSIGWDVGRGLNEIAGTTGRALRLEALKINILNMGTNVYYRLHTQGIGWPTTFARNGGIAGTVGKGLRTEAIQIVTDGLYGVSYQAYVQTYGWTSWTDSVSSEMFGTAAGTTGQAKRMEAVNFKLFRRML